VPSVKLCGLYAPLERASSWAKTRYAKGKDPMGHALVKWYHTWIQWIAKDITRRNDRKLALLKIKSFQTR
jgi:hypothetical protein